MADKRTRAKTKGETITIEAGRGVPAIVTQNLRKIQSHHSSTTSTGRASTTGRANSFAARKQSSQKAVRLSLAGSKKYHRSFLGSNNSGFKNINAMLGIEEYDFPDDDQILADIPSEDMKLDVTALDRYNDDIRKLRRMLIEDCRNFPQAGEPDEGTSRRIKGIVRSLCRSTFYATQNAQALAEGSVIVVLWLLNKKNLSSAFKVHLMQSFTEMVWTSETLKLALYKCNGIRILIRLLVKGVIQRSDQARWACYTLAMACVGCKEIIEIVQDVPQLEEVVGELAFHAYWINWPANFGQVLQGILFGPHSVIPVEDSYQFL